MTMMDKLWLISTLSLSLGAAACVDEPLVDDQDLPIVGGGVGSGDREQGRFLLGGNDGTVRAAPDDLIGPMANTYYLAVGVTGTPAAGAPVTVEVESGASTGSCLKAVVSGVARRCADPIFTGMTFVGPSSGQPRLRIAEAVDFPILGDGGHAATGYRLEHNAAWATGGAPVWEPYCSGDRLAYPLSGRIKRSAATFELDPTSITFSCSEYDRTGTKPTARTALVGNGLVAKAMSWGFVPGAGGTVGGVAFDGASLHRAAVSAGRADYCGNGMTHTLDATSIRVVDRVVGNLVEPTTNTTPISSPGTAALDPTTFSLESVWHQVIGDKVPRWVPVCLSKLRWQSLPIGTHCAAGVALADPRIDPDGHFCDDLSMPDLTAAGATLDVYSQWNDLGLWQWRNTITGDRITTSLGFDTGDARTSVPPLLGYEVVGVAPEGVTLTSVGKQVFEASYGSGLTASGGVLDPIRSCRNLATGDWVTGRPAWLAANGFTDSCHPEGFVWTTNPSATVTDALGWHLVPLSIWRRGTDYVTAFTGPAGYANVITVGSAVAPAAL